MSILFCNIGWMKNYQGIDGDSIKRGGSYNKDSIGHEVCNFLFLDDKVYGYVQPKGQIKIEKLGSGIDSPFVDNVTVVWLADPDSGGTAIIGWYNQARVYRREQVFTKPSEVQRKNGITGYWIEALAKNAVLLPINQRNFMIPRNVKGSIGQSNVWFADADDAQELRREIEQYLNDSIEKRTIPDIEESSPKFEGNPRFQTHLKKERNQKIVSLKKEEVFKKTGALKCEACNFDFFERYGEMGKMFCEVHHIVPLGKIDGIRKTDLKDLAILCSNCHRILHRIDPIPRIEEFKTKINLTTVSAGQC